MKLVCVTVVPWDIESVSMWADELVAYLAGSWAGASAGASDDQQAADSAVQWVVCLAAEKAGLWVAYLAVLLVVL